MIEEKPLTREENFLARMAGKNMPELTPITRQERWYQKIIDNLKSGSGNNFDIVSWADGTDAQIVALLSAAEQGKVDLILDCGWRVGDTRTVQLSSMTATGVGESHEAQTIQLVLSHAGGTAGIERVDGKPIHFQVDQVDVLKEDGYINATVDSTGLWYGSARRIWCNTTYYNAFPPMIRAIFKKMKVTYSETVKDVTLKQSEDYFSLRAAKEVLGNNSYSDTIEADALQQIEWYKTHNNRIKLKDGSAYSWWNRSPNANNGQYFCAVSSEGYGDTQIITNYLGIAPFGCI